MQMRARALAGWPDEHFDTLAYVINCSRNYDLEQFSDTASGFALELVLCSGEGSKLLVVRR